MKSILRISALGIAVIIWLLPCGISQDRCGLNADSVLEEKNFPEFTYSLNRENIEIGFEKSFPLQKLSYFSSVDKYYLTCATTINRDTTMKFSIGSLTADCENTNTGQAVGEFRYIPISIALLGSHGNPPLRPYWGAGFTMYSQNTFRAKDDNFGTYKGTNTNSLSLTGGVKYIPNKNVAVNLALTCEIARPFTFSSQEAAFYPETATLDLSNISVNLNIALRF